MEIARVLFTFSGALWFLIGFLTGFLDNRGVGPAIIFVSNRTDRAVYGRPPEAILGEPSDLTTFRHTAIRVIGGLLIAAGLATAAISWFGLGESQTWALVVLTIIGLAVVPSWWFALSPYRQAGIKLAVSDLPPFMWIPGIVMPVASILGWISVIQA